MNATTTDPVGTKRIYEVYGQYVKYLLCEDHLFEVRGRASHPLYPPVVEFPERMCWKCRGTLLPK